MPLDSFDFSVNNTTNNSSNNNSSAETDMHIEGLSNSSALNYLNASIINNDVVSPVIKQALNANMKLEEKLKKVDQTYMSKAIDVSGFKDATINLTSGDGGMLTDTAGNKLNVRFDSIGGFQPIQADQATASADQLRLVSQLTGRSIDQITPQDYTNVRNYQIGETINSLSGDKYQFQKYDPNRIYEDPSTKAVNIKYRELGKDENGNLVVQAVNPNTNREVAFDLANNPYLNSSFDVYDYLGEKETSRKAAIDYARAKEELTNIIGKPDYASMYDTDGRLGEDFDLVQSAFYRMGARFLQYAPWLSEEAEQYWKAVADEESGQAIADAWAGVRNSTRMEYARDVELAEEALASGNLRDFVKLAGSNIDRFLADSAPQMALQAAVTAATGGSLAAIGIAGKALKVSALLSGASAAATDATLANMESYEYNNNGETMSAGQVLANFAGNLALMIPEGIMMTVNLPALLPKSLRGALTSAYRDKPVKEALKTVAGSTAGEAVQEYAQGVFQEVTTQNQEEARSLTEIATDPSMIAQGLIGGMMGGVLSGASQAVRLPLNLRTERNRQQTRTRVNDVINNTTSTGAQASTVTDAEADTVVADIMNNVGGESSGIIDTSDIPSTTDTSTDTAQESESTTEQEQEGSGTPVETGGAGAPDDMNVDTGSNTNTTIDTDTDTTTDTTTTEESEDDIVKADVAINAVTDTDISTDTNISDSTTTGTSEEDNTPSQTLDVSDNDLKLISRELFKKYKDIRKAFDGVRGINQMLSRPDLSMAKAEMLDRSRTELVIRAVKSSRTLEERDKIARMFSTTLEDVFRVAAFYSDVNAEAVFRRTGRDLTEGSIDQVKDALRELGKLFGLNVDFIEDTLNEVSNPSSSASTKLGVRGYNNTGQLLVNSIKNLYDPTLDDNTRGLYQSTLVNTSRNLINTYARQLNLLKNFTETAKNLEIGTLTGMQTVLYPDRAGTGNPVVPYSSSSRNNGLSISLAHLNGGSLESNTGVFKVINNVIRELREMQVLMEQVPEEVRQQLISSWNNDPNNKNLYVLTTDPEIIENTINELKDVTYRIRQRADRENAQKYAKDNTEKAVIKNAVDLAKINNNPRTESVLKTKIRTADVANIEAGLKFLQENDVKNKEKAIKVLEDALAYKKQSDKETKSRANKLKTSKTALNKAIKASTAYTANDNQASVEELNDIYRSLEEARNEFRRYTDFSDANTKLLSNASSMLTTIGNRIISQGGTIQHSKKTTLSDITITPQTDTNTTENIQQEDLQPREGITRTTRTREEPPFTNYQESTDVDESLLEDVQRQEEQQTQQRQPQQQQRQQRQEQQRPSQPNQQQSQQQQQPNQKFSYKKYNQKEIDRNNYKENIIIRKDDEGLYNPNTEPITDLRKDNKSGGKFYLLHTFASVPVTLPDERAGMFRNKNGNVLKPIRYPSVEHALQASKTTDYNKRLEIAKAKTPGEAKRIGQSGKVLSSAGFKNWKGSIAQDVLKDLLRQRLLNDSKSKQALLDTKDARIEYVNSYKDQFLGVIAETTKDGKTVYRGRNLLGQLLMELRRDLINGTLTQNQNTNNIQTTPNNTNQNANRTQNNRLPTQQQRQTQGQVNTQGQPNQSQNIPSENDTLNNANETTNRPNDESNFPTELPPLPDDFDIPQNEVRNANSEGTQPVSETPSQPQPETGRNETQRQQPQRNQNQTQQQQTQRQQPQRQDTQPTQEPDIEENLTFENYDVADDASVDEFFNSLSNEELQSIEEDYDKFYNDVYGSDTVQNFDEDGDTAVDSRAANAAKEVEDLVKDTVETVVRDINVKAEDFAHNVNNDENLNAINPQSPASNILKQTFTVDGKTVTNELHILVHPKNTNPIPSIDKQITTVNTAQCTIALDPYAYTEEIIVKEKGEEVTKTRIETVKEIANKIKLDFNNLFPTANASKPIASPFGYLFAPNKQTGLAAIDNSPQLFLIYNGIKEGNNLRLEFNETTLKAVDFTVREYFSQIDYNALFSPRTRQEIASQFGNEESATSDELAQYKDFIYKYGVPATNLASRLGKMILNNMGLKVNKNTGTAHYFDRLATGMGMWALEYAQASGMLTISRYEKAENTETDPYPAIKATTMMTVRANKIQRNILKNTVTDFIRGTNGSTPLKDLYEIKGNTPRALPRFKKRNFSQKELDNLYMRNTNNINKIPPYVKRVMNKYNNVKFTIDIETIDFLKEHAKDLINKLGYTDAETRQWQSFDSNLHSEGVNKTLNDQLTYLVAYQAIAKKYKETHGKDLPIYFNSFISKNGRFFLDSTTLNPQTNKSLQRFLVTPANAVRTWDINNEFQMKAEAFAYAQAFDNLKNNENINKLHDNLNNMSMDELKQLRLDLVKMSDSDFKAKYKDIGIDGVENFGQCLNVIKHLMIRKEANGKPFKSNLMIENDSTTSGYFIRMLQFPNPIVMNKFASKVGIFVGENNEFVKQFDSVDNRSNITMHSLKGSGSFLDIYQTMAMSTTEQLQNQSKAALQDLYKEFAEKNKPQGYLLGVDNFNDVVRRGEKNKNINLGANLNTSLPLNAVVALYRDLSKILPTVGPDGKVSKALRTLMKPAAMVFGYGAGFKSIVGKLTETIIGENIDNFLVFNKWLYEHHKDKYGITDPKALENEIKEFINDTGKFKEDYLKNLLSFMYNLDSIRVDKKKPLAAVLIKEPLSSIKLNLNKNLDISVGNNLIDLLKNNHKEGSFDLFFATDKDRVSFQVFAKRSNSATTDFELVDSANLKDCRLYKVIKRAYPNVELKREHIYMIQAILAIKKITDIVTTEQISTPIEFRLASVIKNFMVKTETDPLMKLLNKRFAAAVNTLNTTAKFRRDPTVVFINMDEKAYINLYNKYRKEAVARANARKNIRTLEQLSYDIIAPTYGSAVANALAEDFETMKPYNESLKNIALNMYKIAKMAEDKFKQNLVDKYGDIRRVPIKVYEAEYKKLTDCMPFLTLGYSEGREHNPNSYADRGALLLGGFGRTTDKSTQVQNLVPKVVDNKTVLTQPTSYPEVYGLENPGQSGEVIPIHSLDGQMMAYIMHNYLNNGLIPVHDAVVMSAQDGFAITRDYNKVSIIYGKEYNLLDNMIKDNRAQIKAVADYLGVSENRLYREDSIGMNNKPIVKRKRVLSIGDIIAEADANNNMNKADKEEFYANGNVVISANIDGVDGTAVTVRMENIVQGKDAINNFIGSFDLLDNKHTVDLNNTNKPIVKIIRKAQQDKILNSSPYGFIDDNTLRYSIRKALTDNKARLDMLDHIHDMNKANNNITVSDTHYEHLKNIIRALNPDKLNDIMAQLGLHKGRNAGEYRVDLGGRRTISLAMDNSQSINADPVTKLCVESFQSVEETYTHELVHAATEFAFANRSIFNFNREIQQLLHLQRLASDQFTWEDFMPDIYDPNLKDLYEANAKKHYNYIFNNSSKADLAGLKEFIAYGLTNQKVVNKLKSINYDDVYKGPRKSDNTKMKLADRIIEIVNKIFSKVFGRDVDAVNTIKDILVGNRGLKGKTLYESVQILTMRLSDADTKMERYSDKHPFKILERMYDFLRNVVRTGNEKLAAKIEHLVTLGDIKGWGIGADRLTKVNRSTFDTLAGITQALILLPVSKARRETFFTQIRNFARLSYTDMFLATMQDVANTDEQSAQLEMLALQSRKLDGAAKLTESIVARDLVDAFGGKPLNTIQSNSLTQVGLYLDLQCLYNGNNLNEIKQLLTDNEYLDKSMSDLRDNILRLTSSKKKWVVNQINGLARFMITNKGNEIQRLNASEIYRSVNDWKDTVKADDVIDMIDRLTTMYAIKRYKSMKSESNINNELIKTFTSLSDKGLTEFIRSHKTFVENSKKGLLNDEGKHVKLVESFHVVKGYTKQLYDSSYEMTVGLIGSEKEYAEHGYALVGPIKDSQILEKTGMGLYKKTYSLPQRRDGAAFMLSGQHAMGTTLRNIAMSEVEQVTQDSVTRSSYIAQFVNNSMLRARGVTDRLTNLYNNKYQVSDKEIDSISDNLLPVYNGQGDTVDYRFTMSRDAKRRLLDLDEDGIRVLSKMFGSQTKDLYKDDRNEILTDFLYKNMSEHMHPTFHNDRLTQMPYIKVDPDSSNRFMREGYAVLPASLKSRAKQNELWIREDWLLSLIGAPQYTLAKPITKIEDVLKRYDKRMNLTMLKKFVTTVEGILRVITSTDKANIVLKTPSVLAFNIVSNFMYSVMNGHNPLRVMKLVLDNARAIRDYSINQKEYNRILFKERIGTATQEELRRKNWYRSKMEANILNPLMEKGFYQTIVEDLNTKDLNQLDTINKFLSKNPKASKISDKTRTILKHIYMTEGTPVFDLMYTLTQYSDFVFRAAEYQLRMEKAPKKFQASGHLNPDYVKYEAEVSTRVLEAFINYDKPSSSGEQYANDMGLIYFTKFAKRIQKVIRESITRNPVGVLLFLISQHTFVDSEDILEQNVFNKNWSALVHTPWDNALSAITPIPVQYMMGKSW